MIENNNLSFFNFKLHNNATKEECFIFIKNITCYNNACKNIIKVNNLINNYPELFAKEIIKNFDYNKFISVYPYNNSWYNLEHCS